MRKKIFTICLSAFVCTFGTSLAEKPSKKSAHPIKKEIKDAIDYKEVKLTTDKKKDSKERIKRLLLIKGLYRDGIYPLAYKKAKEYLLKYKNDKRHKEQLITLMLSAAVKAKDDEKVLGLIDFVNKIDVSENYKERLYGTIIKYYAKDNKKLKLALERVVKYIKNKKLKRKFIEALINIYFEEKDYKKLVNMKNFPKDLFILKLISLYKLQKYKELLKESENINRFPKDMRNKIIYYRALAYYKLKQIDKSIQLFEKMEDKNPEILKILISYYLKNKKIDKVKKYLYELSTYPSYIDFSYYLLGYLEDREGKYDRAYQYYTVAARYNTKYGRLAKKRLKQFKRAGILKTFYSVRIGLSSSYKNAKSYIKKSHKKNCFVRPYKKFYGIYCGKFKSFYRAKEELEKYISIGKEDAIIEKLAVFPYIESSKSEGNIKTKKK